MAAPFDPDPNIRTLDRGANNVIINAAAVTTGLLLVGTAKPANSVAYARTAGPIGVEPPDVTFQVDGTGTPTGKFIGSNDLVNWYQVSLYSGSGLYPIAGVPFRYLSATADTIPSGTVTVSAY